MGSFLSQGIVSKKKKDWQWLLFVLKDGNEGARDVQGLTPKIESLRFGQTTRSCFSLVREVDSTTWLFHTSPSFSVGSVILSFVVRALFKFPATPLESPCSAGPWTTCHLGKWRVLWLRLLESILPMDPCLPLTPVEPRYPMSWNRQSASSGNAATTCRILYSSPFPGKRSPWLMAPSIDLIRCWTSSWLVWSVRSLSLYKQTTVNENLWGIPSWLRTNEQKNRFGTRDWIADAETWLLTVLRFPDMWHFAWTTNVYRDAGWGLLWWVRKIVTIRIYTACGLSDQLWS